MLFKGTGKFYEFVEIYYGLIDALRFPPCRYYGPFADDFSMHTDAKASAVIDCGTRMLLAGKNTEQKLEVASLTMILSVLTAIENGNLDDVVTISQNAVNASNVWFLVLETGEATLL